MRAALVWSKAAEEGVEAWLRLADALHWFWYTNGHWSEGRRWLEDALSHGEAAEPSILFGVVGGAWRFAYMQGDIERMRELQDRFMALLARLDDEKSSIIARARMGLLALEHVFGAATLVYPVTSRLPPVNGEPVVCLLEGEGHRRASMPSDPIHFGFVNPERLRGQVG
jgi:hypothetical protein